MVKKKVGDDVILDAYNRLGNVWKVAEEVGLCGQSVHERLIRIKGKLRKPEYTKKQINQITELYTKGFKAGDGKLDLLCKKLNKSKPNVSRMAKRLGLTNKNRQLSIRGSIEMSKRAIKWHENNEHPRGMLGKHHSEGCRRELSKRHKEWFANATQEQKANRSKKQALTKSKNIVTHHRGSWKAGWKTIGGNKYYFRSSWEVYYAEYLEFLLSNNKIESWEYEPKTFVFPDNEYPYTYKPDFKITFKNGNHVWREVKGWFCEISKAKDYKFRKYFPNEPIRIVGKVCPR